MMLVMIMTSSELRKFRNSEIGKFRNSVIRKFEKSKIRKFGNSKIRKFGNSEIRKFGSSEIQDFGNSEIQKFGSAEIWKCQRLEMQISEMRTAGDDKREHDDSSEVSKNTASSKECLAGNPLGLERQTPSCRPLRGRHSLSGALGGTPQTCRLAAE